MFLICFFFRISCMYAVGQSFVIVWYVRTTASQETLNPNILRMTDLRMIFLHNLCKVLSFLEACFDLISGSSLCMKIQIMSGKITENLGFKFFVAFYFQILHKKLHIFVKASLSLRSPSSDYFCLRFVKWSSLFFVCRPFSSLNCFMSIV